MPPKWEKFFDPPPSSGTPRPRRGGWCLELNYIPPPCFAESIVHHQCVLVPGTIPENGWEEEVSC